MVLQWMGSVHAVIYGVREHNEEELVAGASELQRRLDARPQAERTALAPRRSWTTLSDFRNFAGTLVGMLKSGFLSFKVQCHEWACPNLTSLQHPLTGSAAHATERCWRLERTARRSNPTLRLATSDWGPLKVGGLTCPRV